MASEGARAPGSGVGRTEGHPVVGCDAPDAATQGRRLLAIREEERDELMRRRPRALVVTLSCHVVDTGEPRNGLPTYRLPQWKPPVRGEPLVRNVADARDHLDAVIEDTDTKTSKSVVRRLRRYIAKRDCSPQEFVVVGGLTSRPTPSIWKNGTHLILARPFVDTPALSRAELETAARVTKWQHVTDALRLLREVGFIVDQWQERRGMVFRRNVTYVTEHPWLRLAMQQYQDGTPYFVLGERADPLAEMFLTPPPPAVAAGTAKVEGEAE